jgi:D-serine deaminase-like pyridoxal phosphate-dependent protein
LIDHPDQVRFLEKFENSRPQARKWSVFVKIDGGQRYDRFRLHLEIPLIIFFRRAGVSVSSQSFQELMQVLFASPAISVHGFYGHAGNSYASTSLTEASLFLSSEVEAVNSAAEVALAVLSGSSNKDAYQQPFVLSVGSTPTAHAASAETRAFLSRKLHGTLELHAGVYISFKNGLFSYGRRC